MSQRLTISVADSVYTEIDRLMDHMNKHNRSEFCEDLLRIGLLETLKKEGGNYGESIK